jgi:hypothetical protein
MRDKTIKLSLLLLSHVFFSVLHAEAQGFKDGKFLLNEDGSRWLKVAAVNQVWVRSTNFNPGTTKFGYDYPKGSDIGIRRIRVQFMGQLTDRVFFYSQVGENNFNNISDRKLGFFVHDAVGDYAIHKQKLTIGAGLTAWGGLSRFYAPSAGTIMGIDAPLYQQSSNDVTDQFLRKLAVYAKGKLGKLDYRLAIADPMAFQKGSGFNPNITSQSNFSSKPSKKQWNGYFNYQFLDQESNQTPYKTGTYLGEKKVFNIGTGYVFQPQAMWHRASNGVDTVITNMLQLAADVYYDAPIGQKGHAISVYGNYTNFNFGPNYIRNLGPMNPANGSNRTDILNGGGNGFPAFGTGRVLYGQVGYKLKNNLVGKTTLMPYASIQHSNYERLKQPADFTDIGVNWLLSGHASKLTAAWQSRPIFNTDGERIDRKGGFLLQYQVFLN